MDFVRKSVGCIGQVAIRLEAAAQRCVEALLELVQLRVSYVVQEAVVVIKVRPHVFCCTFWFIFLVFFAQSTEVCLYLITLPLMCCPSAPLSRNEM